MVLLAKRVLGFLFFFLGGGGGGGGGGIPQNITATCEQRPYTEKLIYIFVTIFRMSVCQMSQGNSPESLHVFAFVVVV